MVIILLLVTAIVGPRRHKAQWGKVVQGGDKIAIAIAAYKAAKGTYPATLQDLTPTYLSELPEVKEGSKAWGYEKTSDSYSLFVRLSQNSHDVFSYSPGTKDWSFETAE